MLRITENFENGNTVRLRLDGTVSDDAFRELATVFAAHRDGAERTITIDMAGVAFMSDDSARKLAGLRDDHLRIINCSPFIVALLQTVGVEDR
jgi:anti-anti-sigma regulatory factor